MATRYAGFMVRRMAVCMSAVMEESAFQRALRTGTLKAYYRAMDEEKARERDKKIGRLPMWIEQAARKQWHIDRDAHGWVKAHATYSATLDAAVQSAAKGAPQRAQLRAARKMVNAEKRAYEAWLHDSAPDAIGFNSNDLDIREWAKRRATEAINESERAHCELRGDEDGVYEVVAAYTKSHNIEPPEPTESGKKTARSCTLRMQDEAFWRKRGRCYVSRLIEIAAIDNGRVHNRAALYVSDENVARWSGARKRNAEMLETMCAVNEQGELFSLGELADISISNPKIRRCELMTRARGMDDWAKLNGWVPLFFVVTLASKYHRVKFGGKKNDKWDGAMPSDGNNRLCELWAIARAKLAKLETKYYGLRTVEPHHDGTPHWNLLLYARTEADAVHVIKAIRQAAFEDDPNEEGAWRRRLRVKRLNWDEGKSPVGYVAKYICKQIDGHGVEDQTTLDDKGRQRKVSDSATGAMRATAWASVWHIRQFQQIGSPPLGIYRELRRLDDAHADETIEAARAAADDGEYGPHVDAVGGFAVPRNAQRLKLMRVDSGKTNRYGEESPNDVKGVKTREVDEKFNPIAHVITRLHTWAIVKLIDILDACAATVCGTQSEGLTPWTRVNNCNQSGGANLQLVPSTRPFHYKFAAISAAEQSPPGAAPPE